MISIRPDTSATSCKSPEEAAEIALAKKYACQGPRYTSYPTAPQFHPDFPRDQFLNWQRSDNTVNCAPLSLYVHVPFCRDICYYCACNKVVTRDRSAARDYLLRLKQEVEIQSQLVGRHRPITQLHWGGGTPTFLDNAEITELMHVLATHFHLVDSDRREYSIEIDPRTVEADTIALLKGLGFNRISLGIQDFDPLVQKAINRVQALRDIEELVTAIRAHEFRSLSFDLIYGLPHQDRHSIVETLRKVIALQPDRIACYNYAHLPERFTSQRAIDRLSLPSPGEKLELQQIISHSLQAAGYKYIGMDHYVLPEDELALAQSAGRLQRNFQGYSVQLADDLLGLGVSAISQIGDYYLQNASDLRSYYERIDQQQHPAFRGLQVSSDDKLRRYVIMRLICELKLDFTECRQRFGIEFPAVFRNQMLALEPMEADGLLKVDEDGIRVLEQGRPFLRNICMLFDAYLEPAGGDRPTPRFSATL